MTRRIAAGLAATLLLASCSDDGSSDGDATTTTAVEQPTDAGDAIVTVAEPVRPEVVAPVGLTLREGSSESVPGTTITRPATTPLTPEEAAALIDRLPEWEIPPDGSTTFAFPPATLDPPIAGETIANPFPPPDDGATPAETPTGPLNIIRFQPEGEVAVAPFLTVTFDQPMVPLDTIDDLAEADVPVTVEPAIEGRWRWIGTRTLRFEVLPGETDRLPAATEFTVTVPAGTTSATGGALPSDVTWTFSTPPPSVVDLVGLGESTSTTPVFAVVFDQRVTPADALAEIRLSADAADVGLRLADDDEIAADDDLRAAVDAALDDHVVAFTPVGTLSPDQSLTVTVGPGVPSAEGPLTNREAAGFSGRTFGSLALTAERCGWEERCEPGMPLVLEFSNPLDADLFDPSAISIDPPIDGPRIDLAGPVIELRGATTADTTYRVTLDRSLSDVFGQTLGSSETATFDVGDASPQFIGPDRPFITLDPFAEEPSLSVGSVNHDEIRFRAWALDPNQYAAFQTYLEGQWNGIETAVPEEWTLVADDVIGIDASPNELVTTTVDLASAFNQTGSQLVVRIEPTETYEDDEDLFWRNRPTIAWVQRTTLGVDVFVDAGHMHLWATDLRTGEPLGGVPIELLGDGRVATTDDEGLADLELGEEPVTGVFAAAAGQESFAPADRWDGWQRETLSGEARWYTFDDRGIYRPGETIRVAGWIRQVVPGEGLTLYDDTEATYIAYDAQGAELASGSTTINDLGGFDVVFDIPEGANLGPAWVELDLPGGDGEWRGTGHQFQIQEFRTPEFEVTTRLESPPPILARSPATLAVDASFFSGGPLLDAPVDWLVTTRDTTYRPPGLDEYTFGVWSPWWFAEGVDVPAADAAEFATTEFAAAELGGELAAECFDCPWQPEATYESFTGRTDADGRHFLEFELERTDLDLPVSVVAEATVTDVNRQAWADRTAITVHSGELYVGVRVDRPFVEAGETIDVDVVAADIDGVLVEGREIDVSAGRVDYEQRDDEWIEIVVDETTCAVVSGEEPVSCALPTELGGEYRVTATIDDDAGGRNRTELTVWVGGETPELDSAIEAQDLTIVPDAEEYAIGDVAEIFVRAPFAPAFGVAHVTVGDVVASVPFESEDGSAIVPIEIGENWLPSARVHVTAVGARGQTPVFARGEVDLSVPPTSRELDVTVRPASDALLPGASTDVTVEVLDQSGDPVADAGVALVVVDDAVLGLTGYELPDPLAVFYQPVWSHLWAQHVRDTILLTDRDDAGDLVENGRDGGDDMAGEGHAESADESVGLEEAAEEPAEDAAAESADAPVDGGGPPISVRELFDALAVFAPGERTNADGTVTVPVTLPDSLTRFRVMAVAVAGADRFGTDDANITARLPLQVRPSAPRFANYGDRFEVPVVVQNQTDELLTVDVAMQSDNLGQPAPVGQRLDVPAGDRVEVRFPVETVEPGTARARVVANAGDLADAASVEFPVYTPATAEAFATYGTLDDGAVAQPLDTPSGVIPEFGGLEVGTSSTALHALTDAVLYLTEFDYASADGYASRIMAIAGLGDVLAAFGAEGLPDPAELAATTRDDVAALQSLQNDDGGWATWRRGAPSDPWMTAQGTHALVLARDAGFEVSPAGLDSALAWLDTIAERLDPELDDASARTLRAYAVHVRGLAGDIDPAAAIELYREGDLEVDALAWIWPSIIDDATRAEIERTITNRAVDTAGTVTFATSYDESSALIAVSDRRTDAIVLDALITQAPDSDLISPTVAGLLAGQTRGRWDNVHENAFVPLALDRYFDTFEAVNPNFVARAWLGDRLVADDVYVDRETVRRETLVPMPALLEEGAGDVVLQNEGVGRLYYRLGLRYAPSDLSPDPVDAGFVVDRVYEAVDDPDDVVRLPDGTWEIAAGATVRVRVTMVADARRNHVALIDPLPAGLEPENPALATSTTTPPEDVDGAGDGEGEGDDAWLGPWFDHQNLRDDRAEAFRDRLPGGSYEYAYIARATTPGTFVVPPARAEEIYSPETFGRSRGDTVIVR